MKYSILLVFLVLVGCSDPIELTKAPVTQGISQEIEKEFIMELKPIAEFPAYFTVCNQVKGVDGNKLVSVKLIEDIDGVDITRPFHDFMTTGDNIYFQVMTYEQGEAIPETDPVQYESVEKILYFEQYNGTVKEITEMLYPIKLTPEQIEMDTPPFSISIEDGNSFVVYDWVEEYRPKTWQEGDKPKNGYISIDGYYLSDTALLFSVDKGVKYREAGIWIIEKSIGKYVNILKAENCRIWK